jgi:hypothetical protein
MENKTIYAHTGSWDKVGTAVNEAVDHPPHYNKGNIETINYIEDVLGVEGAINYCHGNVLKYTGTRLFSKGNAVEDGRKAIWYMNKILELLEKSKVS